jgi:hypothetical protein
VNLKNQNIDYLINGPDPLSGNNSLDSEPDTPKIKFKVELDSKQQFLIDDMIKLIRAVGDMKDDENRKKNNHLIYETLIQGFFTIKQYFLQQNMYMFMTSGFNAETKIPMFDPDQNKVVEVTFKDIEFTFGDENEPIAEEDMNKLCDFISKEQVMIEEFKQIKEEKKNDPEEAKARLRAKGFIV